MTAEVNISNAIQNQQATNAAQTGLAEDFQQFLTLLTTQIQNQDPLSPMDSAEFTSQLVAFTGVEQQINANQKLDDLIALGISTSLTSAIGYVGLDVSYLGSELSFDGSTPTKIVYALDGEAVEARINITDESGSLVFSSDVSTDTGNQEFTWDGTLNGGGTATEGTYSISIDALDFDGNLVNASTVVSGNVHGVESQNGQIFVLVGERAVPVSNILNANQPEEEPTAPVPPAV